MNFDTRIDTEDWIEYLQTFFELSDIREFGTLSKCSTVVEIVDWKSLDYIAEFNFRLEITWLFWKIETFVDRKSLDYWKNETFVDRKSLDYWKIETFIDWKSLDYFGKLKLLSTGKRLIIWRIFGNFDLVWEFEKLRLLTNRNKIWYFFRPHWNFGPCDKRNIEDWLLVLQRRIIWKIFWTRDTKRHENNFLRREKVSCLPEFWTIWTIEILDLFTFRRTRFEWDSIEK